MSPLAILLVLKIGVTLLAVSGPFLLLPKTTIDALSGYGGTPKVLYRLYGMAVTALLVGYGGGLYVALNGDMPWGVIAMGITSNAGATGVLIITGEARKRPALTAFFGLIALGLVIAVAMPQWVIKPL
ncbi:MAG: hypothetical protein AAGH38_01015 [Pseudomonadota bacterium]